MNPTRPYVLGIAGISCSGKSRLARHIGVRFKEKRPIVVSVDWYYRDLSALEPEERESWNFDTPDAIEMELLQSHLAALSRGKEIHRPVYDFSSHTRSADTVTVVPGELIIVEGLFVLYWEEIRQLLDAKVFVMLDVNDSLSRRLERDVRTRGRTEESVLAQYRDTVQPMAERYVVPSSAFADIVVMGADNVADSAAAIIGRIEVR